MWLIDDTLKGNKTLGIMMQMYYSYHFYAFGNVDNFSYLLDF